MMPVFLLILLVAFSPQQLRTLEQREKVLAPKVFKNSRGETLPYRLFIPSHYDHKKKYPLVLYLHGGGGIGNDNQKQIDGGNGYLIDFFTGDEAQLHNPSFVVAPQSPAEGWVAEDSITPSRHLQSVYELIGELRRTYNIDEARIYVAGQSMGGFGTFAIISEHPQTFAAGVALCGGGDQSKVSRLTTTPIWAFHGAKDESVPVERSRTIVASIKSAGGKVRYTEYPDTGHIIWPTVVKEAELLPWLFAQRK
ncbi:MAG TPA: prolyl oligopeptidase family serine peptidase [Pyrinomonadaceae bacterium]|nr:prolyl oligopeptidase family serine peptidase [Pyrinomonadaceae bacterium]